MTIPYHPQKTAHVNGINIVYDCFGNPADPAILLVAGLGVQLIGWDENFCAQLAEQGYFVIRYDNRDIGLSTQFDEAGVPHILAVIQGDVSGVPYRLIDMAKDGLALLTELGIAKAHIIGSSMGGMIAQTMAIYYPERLLTLTSMMSTTGEADLPQATPAVMQTLLTPSPTDSREAYIDHSVKTWPIYSGSVYASSTERVRERAGQMFDRGLRPAGVARQMAAVVASGGRREQLQNVTTPTLVLHGADDPLIRVEAGKDTARSIPNAKLHIIGGWGHNMPPSVWSEILDAITNHIQSFDRVDQLLEEARKIRESIDFTITNEQLTEWKNKGKR